MSEDYGPLDDFDTPDEDEAPHRPRRYVRDLSELPLLPHPEMRPFTLPHDFVSDACTHRLHGECGDRCPYCAAGCLCVCHRWAIPVESL